MTAQIWPWVGSHPSSGWPWLLNVSTSATLAKGEDYRAVGELFEHPRSDSLLMAVSRFHDHPDVEILPFRMKSRSVLR